jgi:hypothetical protein
MRPFVLILLLLFCNFSLIIGQYIQRGNELLGEEIEQRFGTTTAVNENGQVVAISSFVQSLSSNTHPGQVQIYEWHNDN